MSSFKVEVTGVPRGNWASNSLRFATRKEADAYALDLAMRWSGMGDWRVVECDDPVPSAIVGSMASWRTKP